MCIFIVVVVMGSMLEPFKTYNRPDLARLRQLRRGTGPFAGTGKYNTRDFSDVQPFWWKIKIYFIRLYRAIFSVV